MTGGCTARDFVELVRRGLNLMLALVLAGASGVLPATTHAAGLSITPANVAASYSGAITLNITGLASGQMVRVEEFLDTNASGTIDSGEILVQGFSVTDGQALMIDAVRNRNVPGDEDGSADGKIRALLNFQVLAEANRAVASYVYKVSPTSPGFTPVVAAFTITQPTYAQKIVGRVVSGVVPVPFAFALLIQPDGGPILTALADADGNFTLNSSTGTYLVGAVKEGFLFDFDSAPQVTIHAGATVTQDVSLSAANRTISGRLTDVGSGAGLPGAQVLAQTKDPELVALVFTDTEGNFTVPVSTASTTWGVDGSEKSAALLGYLALSDSVLVDVSAGSVANVAVRWARATALVYGTLTDNQANPVAAVGFYSDNHGQYEAYGSSDSNGDYTIGVAAGTWEIRPESDDLTSRGYLSQGGVDVTVISGQALRQDFLVQRATAYLSGRVTDDGGNPVGNAHIAADGAGDWHSTVTDANGNFSLGVFAGHWYLTLDSDAAAERDLVRPFLEFDVVDGVDITGITYVARQASAHITGWIKDNTNTPVAAVGVSTWSSADGIQYDSYRETDASGNFSLHVFNGTWQVGVSCGDLQARGYICPSGQSVTISGSDRTLYITVLPTDYCPGDCSGDDAVALDELIDGVNITLGALALAECPHFDTNSDTLVTVEELVAGVNNAVNLCPGATFSPQLSGVP